MGATQGADQIIPVAKAYVQEHLFDKFDASKLDKDKIIERMDHMVHCLENFKKYMYPKLVDLEPELEVTLEAPFRKGVMRGVIDVMKPEVGMWWDWKSGMKLPTERMLMRDPQAIVYYWLAEACGIPPPTRFDYVYLTGKNVNTITKTYGPKAQKAGQQYASADKDNPKWLFSFPVFQDADKVRRIFNEWVIPLAKQYEQKVYVKRVSDMNCAGCMYRTACATTELPEVKEDS